MVELHIIDVGGHIDHSSTNEEERVARTQLETSSERVSHHFPPFLCPRTCPRRSLSMLVLSSLLPEAVWRRMCAENMLLTLQNP